MLVLATLITGAIEPSEGPGRLGDLKVSPLFFFIMFGLGFAIGTVGHLVKSRVLVGAGIALVFLATVLLPVALGATR